MDQNTVPTISPELINAPEQPKQDSSVNTVLYVSIGLFSALFIGVLSFLGYQKMNQNETRANIPVNRTVTPSPLVPTVVINTSFTMEEEQEIEALDVGDVDADLEDLQQDVEGL